MILNGILLKKLTKECIGEILASLLLVWRFVFAGKHLKIATVNTELSGVFLAKQHSAGERQLFRRAKLRDKSKHTVKNIMKAEKRS